jgi:hypothetical protein
MEKNKINWYYLIVGAVLLSGYFYLKDTGAAAGDLDQKTVTLKRDVEYMSTGSRSEPYYRLWVNETKAAFKIEVPGGIAAGWSSLDSLKRGDTLVIKYLSASDADLQDGSKELSVYSLERSGSSYFTTAAYNQANKGYTGRWRWIMLTMAVLLILRGTTILSERLTWILAAVCAGVILVLRVLNKF